MIYKRWQTAAIIIAVLIGILAALPNLVGPEALRFLPFSQQIYLGLDLKGGTYLQLQVDVPAAEKERAQATLESVRSALIRARVPASDLHLEGNAVSIRLRDPAQQPAALKLLQPIAGPNFSDYTITTGRDGSIILQPSAKALAGRTDDILTRSIEIVRRRIDQTGVAEPTIARQGSDRIVIELPGVQDPDRLKRLLGTTAKMTFRLVDTNAHVDAAGKGPVPPEDEVLFEDGPRGHIPYVVQRRVAVAGEHLSHIRHIDR